MGVIATVKDLLGASTGSSGSETRADERSKGAYWCHDCGERVRDVAVEGDSAPDCPDCGDEMAFERFPDSGGCAC
ncbi:MULTISPECIES: zinc-ribbon domain-containing protein [Halorussus]|uniref:zinc-ribbon domain-containing protein n=1 Tax=Halorussus TaxID=1070314 RepID=UPI000E217890|nr:MULTISPECIES: zinc-ribbon domain-containing protein [Halorussus]NHN60614.1 hypothetical protein [Halorussus sp. JP-T4]